MQEKKFQWRKKPSLLLENISRISGWKKMEYLGASYTLLPQVLWRSLYEIFLKQKSHFLPWSFSPNCSAANNSLLGSGDTFNVTLLLFSLFEQYLCFFADPLNWLGICICYPWYCAFGVLKRCMCVQHWPSCCSMGIKTAAVTGCSVFE